jgi:restriction system protein
MTNAWVIRAGRVGERDSWALQHGFSGGGWYEVPDLSTCLTRDQVSAVVTQTFAGEKQGTIYSFIGQLWALRSRIQPGDLLVMPLKTTRQIALGWVTGGYTYRADEPDPTKRQVVTVDWKRTDLPRTSVKQDLLFTLGSAMSIFAPSWPRSGDPRRGIRAGSRAPARPGDGVSDAVLTSPTSLRLC